MRIKKSLLSRPDLKIRIYREKKVEVLPPRVTQKYVEKKREARKKTLISINGYSKEVMVGLTKQAVK